MTLTKERVEELEKELGSDANDIMHTASGPQPTSITLSRKTVRALISAYRTREAAIAECEAWRAWEAGGDEASEIGSVEVNVEASPSEIEQMWVAFNAEMDALHNVIREARAATDAARRLEGQ